MVGTHSMRDWSGVALASPLLAFMVVFFLIPCGLLFGYSFFTSGSFGPGETLSFDSYGRALTRGAFYKVTRTALVVGFVTALVTTAISFPVAYWIVFRTRSNLVLYVVLITLFSSYLVRVYSWRTILGTTGLVNSGLKAMGVITEPIGYFLFNTFSVTLTLVHIYAPFALLLIVAALREVKRDYLEAARDLGAGASDTFLKVTLPLTIGGVTSTFMFTLVLAAGDYVTPQLVGGRTGVTTGLFIADEFRKTGDWPYGAAMTFILLGLFLFIYFLLVQATRLARLAPRMRHPR